MPDTKAESEAIALAKEIVAHRPVEGSGAWSPWEKKLARALLSLSAPGAQYRAGMERAGKLCLLQWYGPPSNWANGNPERWHLADPCSPRDASMHDNGINDCFGAIRAELAALPAPTSEDSA